MSDRLFSRVGHGVLRAAVTRAHRAFVSGSRDVESAQRARLARLLGRVAAVDADVRSDWRWEEFRARMPVTTWSHWCSLVERQRAQGGRYLVDSPVDRYQPTSGSTSAIKWIPYTRQFLAELDAAIGPWLADLYRQYPGVRRGHHYWSLSWLPTSMRAAGRGDLNDDMTLLSSGKRGLVKLTQAVPQEASLANTSDDSLFATLACLAADGQLSALSVWSPTFALNLLERLADWRADLADALERGNWGARAAGIHGLRCPRAPHAAWLLRTWNGAADPAFFAALWPQLALVSAWDTAAAAPWAARLRTLLPHAAFQGKGLWATEGVVTIPVLGQSLLAYHSHVYEFENLDDGRILAPWELREGQRVSPLLSTGSGLLRYRMNDILQVDGFLGSVPGLRFIGRDDGTDLVGEKIGAAFVQSVLDGIDTGAQCLPVTVLALDDAGRGKPGYLLLLDDMGSEPPAPAQIARLAGELERAFGAHFHYQLARNLGQLDAARVVCAPAMRAVYGEHCRRHGMIEGNIKIEPLRHWRGALPGVIAAGLAPHPVATSFDAMEPAPA